MGGKLWKSHQLSTLVPVLDAKYLKEYEGKVHVKVYKAGKDFDYIPKYGAVTKSMVVINEKKAVTKLTKPAIRKAFEEALKTC
mgnify:CR=1 FL=1